VIGLLGDYYASGNLVVRTVQIKWSNNNCA
jgi:hypothetical protein